MSADLAAFVDSNVLVYAVSRDEPEKQKKAREIVERGFTEGDRSSPYVQSESGVEGYSA